MSLLAVENLTVAYGDMLAVQGVSFAFDAGAAFVLLGANGAGKTSVLRCISGLVPALTPTRGLLWLWLVGCFLFVGGNGLVNVAEKSVPSGVASVLVATTPLWMALLELGLPQGERLTGRGFRHGGEPPPSGMLRTARE